MLTNIMATGKFAWTPSQGMFLDDVRVGDGTKNTSNNDVNLEEGSEDFKEDSIPNYVSDVNNIWLLVSILVLVLATLVLVVREKPLNIVLVRVLKRR